MQSLDSNLPGSQTDFNLRRLERYIVMINEGRITPAVFLSKSDLISPEEIEKKKKDIRKILPDVTILAFSNNKAIEIENIKIFLNRLKLIVCLVHQELAKQPC